MTTARRAVLAAIAVFLAVAIAVPAYALYLEIPASTTDRSYVLNLDPPVWIKITLKDLVANASMDNVALTFRDPQLYELFHIYIKTGGEIWYSYRAPEYLGKWGNGTEIYVGLFSDKADNARARRESPQQRRCKPSVHSWYNIHRESNSY
ncbi:MAG: hypothetical protein QXJ26_00525 [Desulfurococcaceae archaeon]